MLDADLQKKREGELKVRQCKEMCNVEVLVANQRLALFTVRCLLIVDSRPLMFFWLLGTYLFMDLTKEWPFSSTVSSPSETETFSISNRCSAWHSVEWRKPQGRQVCRLIAYQDLLFVASLL